MESFYKRDTESSATYQNLNRLNRPFWIKSSRKTPSAGAVPDELTLIYQNKELFWMQGMGRQK